MHTNSATVVKYTVMRSSFSCCFFVTLAAGDRRLHSQQLFLKTEPVLNKNEAQRCSTGAGTPETGT